MSLLHEKPLRLAVQELQARLVVVTKERDTLREQLREAALLLDRGKRTLRDLSILANTNVETRRLLIAVGDAFNDFTGRPDIAPLLEQIAREIVYDWLTGEVSVPPSAWQELRASTTSALLAAEERGRTQADDSWLSALKNAGWPDAVNWGDGAEDPSEGRQAICCRLRDELEAARTAIGLLERNQPKAPIKAVDKH